MYHSNLQKFRNETAATSVGVNCDAAHGAVSPALHLSSTYAWKNLTEKPAFDYSRSGNPTRCVLGEVLCDLEEAETGIITSSGMAAVDLVLNLLKPGDVVLAPHDCYGGTFRLLKAREKQGKFKVHFVDQSNPQSLRAAFQCGPKLVLIETPSNPLLRITDIRDVVDLAGACGAITVADNTFLSPVLQKPLNLGCDIVIHSTSKFINGHSDVVGGGVLCKDKSLGSELEWWANCAGVTGAPFDSFLTLRGVRTLFPRVERQSISAQSITEKLSHHHSIEKIYFPGLKSHPGHDVAARQQKGFGSLLSFEVSENVDLNVFFAELNLITLAESLGGFESLICVPSLMTHASMTPEARKNAGIKDTLIRFSVGLENETDLFGELEKALDRASTDRQKLTQDQRRCA